jgi:hypothetical protein
VVQVHHAALSLVQRGRPDKEIFSDLDLRGTERLANFVPLVPSENIAAFYDDDFAF